ncbi:hypothetical protein NUACC26_081620 [Scytonema sp. NUACC26]
MHLRLKTVLGTSKQKNALKCIVVRAEMPAHKRQKTITQVMALVTDTKFIVK